MAGASGLLNLKDQQRIRELLRLVPGPPGEPIPAGIGDIEFADFQRRTGLELPEDVKSFLRITNGPCVGPGGLYGIRPIRSNLAINSVLSGRPEWEKRKWIPIAGDGCGNQYLLATAQEFGPGFPVFFVDVIREPNLPTYIVGSEIGRFLIFLLERELGEKRWPFNKEYVTQNDPAIVRFSGLPLPWEA